MKKYDSVLDIKETNSLTKYTNYALAYMSIAQCGIGSFYLKETVLVMFVLLVGFSLLRGRISAINVLPWALLMVVIYLYQALAYGSESTDFGDFGFVQIFLVFIRHGIPLLYLAVIGKEYFKYYIKILYVLSIIGLLLWGVTWVFPMLDSLLRRIAIEFSRATGSYVVDYKSINLFYVYTFTYSGGFSLFPRNAGPFWEPGAYAVYLGVAIVLYFIFTGSLRSKHVYVFIIAMITTQSTAGYFSLAGIFVAAVLLSASKSKFILLATLLVLFILIYQFAPFLHDKVTDTVDTETNRDINTGAGGRIFAARKSINAIQRYPLFGRGITRRTSVDYESEYAGAYGIIDMPARYGILAAIIYLYFLIKSFRILSSVNFKYKVSRCTIYMLLSLLPVYFSQGVYGSVVNLLIMQTAMLYKRNSLNDLYRPAISAISREL